jgi:cell division protein FtsW
MKFAFPSFGGNSTAKPVPSLDQRSKMMAYDQPLVWVVMLLLLFGMVMVYSASISLPDSPKYARYDNAYFLSRQAMFIAISLFSGLLAFRVRIETWQRLAPYLFVATLVLLVLVLVPG